MLDEIIILHENNNNACNKYFGIYDKSHFVIICHTSHFKNLTLQYTGT